MTREQSERNIAFSRIAVATMNQTGAPMGTLILVSNLVVTIAAGLGIYSFSSSVFWAAVGAFLLGGSARATPWLALVSYPAVEYFFGNGLTIYSAIVVGITLLQFGMALGVASSQRS